VAWYLVPKGAHVARTAQPKPVLIALGSKKATRAGRTTLRVKLTKRGRTLLRTVRRGHRLTLTAKGSFTPTRARKVTTTRAITLRN
jgi:hypothetical protein